MLNFNGVEHRPVPGFEGLYTISSEGVLTGVKRGVVKASSPTGTSQYLYAKLYKDNKLHNISIHRLVARAFVPNPHNKPMVNHIDGNKLNNNACNLEWVTCSENHRHAFVLGLRTVEQCKTQLGNKCGITSKYHNVSYDKTRNRWKASAKVSGKTVFQKRFSTEQDAAKYINEMIDVLGLVGLRRNTVE